MAQYQHLPIYKTTYELLQAVTRATVRHARAKLDGMCRARAPVADVRAVANSYLAILGKASAWRERKRLGNLLRGHGHVVALQNNRMFTERIQL